MRFARIRFVSWAAGAFAGCLALSIASPSVIYASDHIDGEITKTQPLADLSDFYAFPSKDGKALSLILNTYPIAHSAAHFSSRISYAFVLRELSVSGTGFATGRSMRIDCRFLDEHDHAHSVLCTASNDLTAVALEEEVRAPAPMRAFFGRRSDPFFFNSDWALATSTTGQLAKSDGENTMSSLNALSLAVQIDLDQVFDGKGMLALAVEATTPTASGNVRHLDRIGRPEITNVTLIHREGDADIRDQVNQQPAFDLSRAAVGLMSERLRQAIAYYDALDGKADWSVESANRLVSVLEQDFLVVDPGKPCRKDAFLEIETAVLAGRAHQTCGGRKPSDDIIDRLYTLYVSNDRVVIGDGVDAPYRRTSSDFPHLTAPVTGLWSWFKTWLGNRKTDR